MTSSISCKFGAQKYTPCSPISPNNVDIVTEHVATWISGIPESLNSESATAEYGRSIKKWAGVKGSKSLGSIDFDVRGREFNVASI